jgi:hypothetical protein
MALPDSYTHKPGSIPAYFDAMLNAEAPDRFSQGFLESLEFKSTNDRTLIGVLKELDFIDTDGVPKDRYFEFLDRSQAEKVVADGVREAYSDLFAVNKNAEELGIEDVKNKLRTLYKGAKKDSLINRIASTFVALCEYADFSGQKQTKKEPTTSAAKEKVSKQDKAQPGTSKAAATESASLAARGSLSLGSLQYHINIVLPESRDQAVYDAIFKSLREHLGPVE